MPSRPTLLLPVLTLLLLAVPPAAAQQPGGAITGIDGERFLGEQVAVGDFDGDGLPDLLVRSRTDGGHRLRLFLGADGLPAADLGADEAALVLADYALEPGRPRDFVTGDFNGDGLDDIVLQSSLFCGGENLGAGIEGALDVPTEALAVGDLNGDGIDDLIVGGAHEGGMSAYYVFLGGPRFGALCDGLAAPLGAADADVIVWVEGEADAARALATGDLNGDGFDDLLLVDTSARASAFGAVRGAAFVFFGSAALAPERKVDARGEGADAAVLGVGDDGEAWPEGVRLGLRSSIAAGDLDGDGFDDLVLTARWADGYGVSHRREVLVFRGGLALAGTRTTEAADGRIAFSNELWLPPPGEELLVAVSDLDGDGVADLLGAAAPIDEYRASWARLGPLAFPFEITDPVDFDFFSSGTSMFAVLMPPLPLGPLPGGAAFVVAEPNAGIASEPFEPQGRVQAYTFAGGSVAAEGPAVPAALEVLPAYPNPARAGEAVRLGLRLAEPAEVQITLYDALGRRVAVLAPGPLGAGAHEVRWEGAALAAGAYFYRVEAGSQTVTRRLTLVR